MCVTDALLGGYMCVLNCRTSRSSLEAVDSAMLQENKQLASAVCTHLGVSVEGMKDFYWPCR